MNRHKISAIAIGAALVLFPSIGHSQSHSHDHPHLHVSDRWDDCAFQLDASLGKDAWGQFTRELGLVMYMRPLRDAAPMGRGNVEVSMVQSTVGIDDHGSAWNDTFVHPDSAHFLFEGSGLPLPGLMARVGVTDRVDVGAYFTRNPNANYGVASGQVQYNVLQQAVTGVAASARVSAATLFGPDDVDATMLALDVVASRKFGLSRRLSVSPYAGISGYMSSASESSSVVNLADERKLGAHAMAGAVAQFSVLQVAFEYNAAAVQTRSLRIGVAF